MGWSRHAGAIVSLALLASIVANYAVHRHFESRFQTLLAMSQIERADSPEPLIFDETLDDSEPSPIPRYLDGIRENRAAGMILPALQIGEADERRSGEPNRSAPEPVPVPNDAVPLADESRQGHEPPERSDSPGRDAVRSVIEDELAGASREERDIWFEELKSLPAGVVRDLLKVRKQLRAIPSTLHRRDQVASKVAPKIAPVPAQQASQMRRQTGPDWFLTLDALERASAIARHNLANATTPGFKRVRAMLVDSVGTSFQDEFTGSGETGVQSNGQPISWEGCRLSGTVLDLTTGRLMKTGRQLDLAIDGEGWFVVLVGERLLYTRCGALILDEQRRLCLAAADESAVLQPVIQIPDDSREIEISARGDVLVLRQLGADPELVGQLELARFPSPARLRPVGGTLLAQTESSGVAEPGSPDDGGRGVIQQGCLEQSNVDVDAELAEIEQWQALQKSFPGGARPVTASGSEPTSR